MGCTPTKLIVKPKSKLFMSHVIKDTKRKAVRRLRVENGGLSLRVQGRGGGIHAVG